MKLKSVKLNLLVIYFVAYGALACYFPFLAVYFKSRGLNYIQSGFAFSLTSLVSIGAQPLMGYISDKYLNKKLMILINMLACTVLIYLYILADGFYGVIFAIIALLLFQSSIMSIMDAYCYDIAEKDPQVNYGQVRLMGSVGFAFVSLALGLLIQSYGINTSFYMYSAFFLIAALFVSGINYKSESHIARPTSKDVLEVLKNYKFILFVLSVLFLNISLQSHSSYIATLIEATGGNVANLGIVWFGSAISELPAFFFSSKLLKRVGVLNIYMIAVVLYMIRMLLSAYSSSYSMVIAVQLMQSITYPLYMVAVIQYVYVIVPDKVKASGITLLSSLGFGLGGLIGNLGGGFILQYKDPFFLYKAMAMACFVALIIALLLKLMEKSLPARE